MTSVDADTSPMKAWRPWQRSSPGPSTCSNSLLTLGSARRSATEAGCFMGLRLATTPPLRCPPTLALWKRRAATGPERRNHLSVSKETKEGLFLRDQRTWAIAKKYFNKHFQGANSELNSLYFPIKNTLNSEEWPNFEKNLLNAMTQVSPLLIFSFCVERLKETF